MTVIIDQLKVSGVESITVATVSSHSSVLVNLYTKEDGNKLESQLKEANIGYSRIKFGELRDKQFFIEPQYFSVFN